MLSNPNNSSFMTIKPATLHSVAGSDFTFSVYVVMIDGYFFS